MQTNQDPEDFYEVLGVRPGATLEEIKAAYRDMAKVWHPDRFAHDPKLEQKAQEKLKEINEAYKQLSTALVHRPRATRTSSGRAAGASNGYSSGGASSGHTTSGESRARAPRGFAAYTQPHARARRKAGSPRKLSHAILALAVFGVVLLLAFPVLKSKSGEATPRPEAAPVAAQPDSDFEASGQPGVGARKGRKPSGRREAGEDSGPVSSEPARAAIPTVNLTVDPTTGLLATASCPNRMLVTFVRGEEPRRHCDAQHRPAQAARREPAAAPATPEETAPAPTTAGQVPAAEQQKPKSKVKSILKTVVSPGKWFRRKKQE